LDGIQAAGGSSREKMIGYPGSASNYAARDKGHVLMLSTRKIKTGRQQLAVRMAFFTTAVGLYGGAVLSSGELHRRTPTLLGGGGLEARRSSLVELPRAKRAAGYRLPAIGYLQQLDVWVARGCGCGCSPNLTVLRPPNRTPSTGSPPSRCLYQTPAAMGGRAEHP
jgi:hypothetical protein